MGEGIILF